MKRSGILIFGIVFFLAIVGTLVYLTFFSAKSKEEEVPETVYSAETLLNECFYIWHDPYYSLESDLEGTTDETVFSLCPKGVINWKKNEHIAHTLWFSSSVDHDIPTLYPGDKLIFKSATSVPFKGISWERFADYGYTIGVANLVKDDGGHYRIPYNSNYGYSGYVNTSSDAAQLSQFFAKNNPTDIFLDKVGNVSTQLGIVSDGGTILELDKDSDYLCKWYKGSNVSDFRMKADQHTFCFLEKFETSGFEFFDNNDANDLSNLHSCIIITVPEWLKTGYYYVAETGFFRFVSMDDLMDYNGLAYDPNIEWNDPIILYDEKGELVYNPASGVDRRDEYNSKHGTTVYNVTYDIEERSKDVSYMTVNEDHDENPSDVGAGYYENQEQNSYSMDTLDSE